MRLTALCLVLLLAPLRSLAQEATLSPHDAGTDPWLAFNLADANDWSQQVPFIDRMRVGRRWIGHLPGQWGGWSHDDLQARGYLDDNGWPLRVPSELEGIATLVLTYMAPEQHGLAGRYRLTHDGQGQLEISGQVRNLTPGRGRQSGSYTFDYTPGDGLVTITIRRTDPDDPIRNISVVHERHQAAHDDGALFNPDWITRLRGARALRFMDWGRTNDSTLQHWPDRPQVTDYSWEPSGVPLEVMIRLANEMGADPWFTLPHMADDDFIRRAAELVRDQLDPDLRAYVELSNEVWNWQFGQARWAEDQARARWGQEGQWQQFYAMRAAQMVMIWDEVFAGQRDRLIRVIATQAGWRGLEAQLEAPLWQAEDPANPAPPELFDAYAITGYFSGALGEDPKVDMVRDWLSISHAKAEAQADAQGLEGAERQDFISAHRFDHAADLAARELRDGALSGDKGNTLNGLIETTFPYHAEVAQRWGLDLIMYEGGTHVVGIGTQTEDENLTEFFAHLNYTEQMGALYRDLLAGWYRAGGDLFNAYYDVGRPGRSGSWGALRHLDDHNPRWEALVTFDPAMHRP